MSVKKEFLKTRADGEKLYRSYSDEGRIIRKIGTDELYEDAVDIEGSPFEYVETDYLIGADTEEDPSDIIEEEG